MDSIRCDAPGGGPRILPHLYALTVALNLYTRDSNGDAVAIISHVFDWTSGMTTDTASKFTLRPYQQEAIDAIRRDFDAGHKSVLLVLPTGAGKTVVFSEFIRTFEGRVLVLAHRKDLVNQAAKSLSRHLGERVGIEMAGQRALTKPEDEH